MVSDSQLMHDGLGLLVESTVAESYASLGKDERRVSLALDLAQKVRLETHGLLGEMNESFFLLTQMIEIIWRCAFDFDLRDTTAGPDFYSYPSIHPSVASDAGLVEDERKRMRLENHEYQTSRFRRLHIELGKRNDGLEVMRMVMFPRARYALPILALDMVAINGRVSFVIADASPVSESKEVPEEYAQAMAELKRKYFPSKASQVDLPDWATTVLSEGRLCARPGSPDEVSDFIGYCAELVNFHVEASKCFGLVRSEETLSEVYRCHQRYAGHQSKNEKTRKILEASFGANFTDEYMRTTLFDFECGLYSMPEESDIHFGLAKVRNLQGGTVYVPNSAWTPAEEITMLRLQNQV